MKASNLRRLAADLSERLEALPADDAVRGPILVAIRALEEEAARLEGGLRTAIHPVTVDDVVTETTRDGLVRKAPSMREMAEALGCTHGFLSQARSGKTRIRRSWARKIAKWRPDLPATSATWPKGWAPEPDEG